MKCESVMKKFLESDQHDNLSLSIRWHMLFCPRCRKEIVDLSDAFKFLRTSAPFEKVKGNSDEIMAKIWAKQPNFSPPISPLKWIVVGMFMFFSAFAISFSNVSKIYFGSDLEIPLNLAMGFLLSLYVIVSIGTHIEKIKEIIEKNSRLSRQ